METREPWFALAPDESCRVAPAGCSSSRTGFGSLGYVSERLFESGLTYADGEPVVVRIRQRGRRIDIDDDGAAVARARAIGTTSSWLDVAERVVLEDNLNVNRRGVIFVPAVEGRDVDALAARVARSSRALEAELLAEG
jgi:hypothetical protein